MKLLVLLFLCCAFLPAQVTVVLLRHAEKTAKYTSAGLTLDGRRRAEALAGELAPLGPVALYASDHRRTQQTLEPLSRALGLPLRIRDRVPPEAVAAEILREFKGGTVVVCAHSDTLGPLAHALGYPGWIPEVADYDRLWILRTGPGGGLEERRQKGAEGCAGLRTGPGESRTKPPAEPSRANL